MNSQPRTHSNPTHKKAPNEARFRFLKEVSEDRAPRKTGAIKFTSRAYSDFRNMLYKKSWVVSVREPVKRPERVVEYLARYTYRVAIANSRIKKLENGMVSFTTKNRKKQRIDTITI